MLGEVLLQAARLFAPVRLVLLDVEPHDEVQVDELRIRVRDRVSLDPLAQFAHAAIPLRQLDIVEESQGQLRDLLLHLLWDVSVSFLGLNEL